MRHVHKWISTTDYVDLQTGEIITKSEYERDYYKVRNTQKKEIKEVTIKNEKLNYGYVRNTTECRKHGKTRLQF